MMSVFTTVSVLGSLMVWLGYRTFFIANNNQANFAQARSLEEDNNQVNSAQVRSVEEDFALGRNKLQTNTLQAQNIPSLPQGLLDDRASKSVEDNFQNKPQSKTPFIEDVPILPSPLLDDKAIKLNKNNFQNKPHIKAPQIEDVPSSPSVLPNKETSFFLEEEPNNRQTFSSLLPVVLNDINILKGSQNGEQTKISLLQNTTGLLQVLLGDIENRVVRVNDQNNLPSEIPLVENVSSFPPVLDDVSNVLEEESQSKEQTKTIEAQNVPSLPSDVLDDKGNVLKEKDLNKDPTEISQIQNVPRLPMVTLSDMENKVLAEVSKDKEQANIHQLQNVPELPLFNQDDLDSKALKAGGIQQELHSNADLYKVVEARSLFDLGDNYLNDIKPEIDKGNLDDFHKDEYKEIPLNEDNHSESNGQGAGLENNHSYEDDVIKVHKKLKISKSDEHKFSLFDILKVPGFGEHKSPNIDSNKNPPKIYLYILHSLLSYTEYENAVKSNPVVVESPSTEEELDAIVPVVSDVPQAANKSDGNEEDEATSDSIDVKSLSGNYMSRLDWQAQAVIGVSVVVILLLLVSIILFVSFHCRRKKRRQRTKKKGHDINK